ncbi:hypothetical protein [uncultured Alistipes sp.]|uniref:hypothetical protein n=1 Tax=uncultured Alistipes sp. TaxID=538949 RepID=UPI0025F70183|nr:hypothetical protein [uncultured Alistipes sp.]
MRKLLILCSALIVATAAGAQHLGEEYRLKKVIPVEGRQGIAIDENYYYVSDSKALYKYDKEGKMLMKNDNPFKGLKLAANHFGDIDVWNEELYCGIEVFEDGRGHNIQIAIYDAKTLTFKRSLEWDPASGQVEVSGLAVDRARNMVWMSDWVDSRYVYCYSLETGKYYTKMQCRPTPYWCQGIFIADNTMLFSADDGESTFHIADNIYAADISEVVYTGIKDGEAAGAKAGRLRHFREMTDFKRAGEIEGLSIDPVNDDLVVLNNRGVQIILGMPKGPFTEEGYTGEIHELYIYEKVR